MKKALLPLILIVIVLLLSLSIYFLKQPGSADKPNVETTAFANLAAETSPNASSLEETPSTNGISPKLPEQKTERSVSGLKTTDRFAGATVIKTRETAPDKSGRYERKRLVRAAFKYPLILLEESLQRDSKTGDEQLIRQTAMVADHIMVKVPSGSSETQVNQAASIYGGRIRKKMHSPDLYLVEFQNVDLDSVAQAVQNFSKDPVFSYAEPDYICSVNDTTPNDPDFNLLWGMHNSGQTVGGQTGIADADIDAPEAWDLSTGSSDIIVAVIDTGIDYNHPDLAGNMWSNPGEIPGNSIDDDGNGFIDDVYGWDFCNDDNNPFDDHFHGTHCAGTIGGAGNNSAGVAGVCWNVRMMALKFLDSSGSGSTSDAVDATHYATVMKAKLSSNSWGGGGYSQGLFDVIEEAGRSNILFVAAAGNAGGNTDTSPNYPSCYTNANIVAVAATDNRDQLAYFSNYGLTSVDLGAPGVYVWSCQPGNQYQYLSGTSMATPHVAGACALVWSINPGAAAAAVKQAVLDGAEPITALNGKCVTGGRLNVYTALQEFEQNMALTPATGTGFSGFYGGPFSPLSSTYTISNIGTNSFSWTAAKTANWMDLSATTGNLSPGQSNTVVVSINTSNANLLAIGTYTDTLTFSNTISTNVQTRTISLTVHGEISFASASYTVLEGAGTALISVHRSGNTNRAVTVDFATSNGTATAGSDYTATNGTLTFATGDTVKTFCVGIIDDVLSVEPAESLMLTLSNSSGGSTLGNPSSATLTIQDNTVTNGLVLKYTFDPDTTPVATDGSPFGNNGQLVNASVVSGQSGNGVSFNGTNAYIRTPSSESLMPTAITLSTWVKINGTPGGWKSLVFKRNTSFHNNEDFSLQLTPDGMASVVIGNGTSQKVLNSSSVVTGEWHHIAATFNQPDLKIYVDGQLEGTTTYNLPLQHNSEAAVLIGCRDHTYNPLSNFLDGLMDDIRIYNRALTAEEIALLAPPMYALTVQNGSGDGSYTNGTQVEIVADTPATGKAFDRWTGDTQYVDSVTSSTATVTMPTNPVSLTATYINLPGWYTLTINNGTGGGAYTNGQQVEISANAPAAGKIFDRWTGDTQYVNSVTSPTATVTMPSQAVSLTAAYNDVYYTLTVENGSGDGSYTNGTVVAVSADAAPEGSMFFEWTTVPTAYTNRLANRLSASTTFTMPGTNVILTATYSSLTNGLVLRYTFDPDTSPTATDSSSYGNNGTFVNAQVATGLNGNGVSFNGTNAYIRTPSSGSLMPTAITLSTWVKINGTPGEWMPLVFKRNTSFNNNEDFSLQLTPDGKASVVIASGTSQKVLNSLSAVTGGWHHMAATFETPNLKIYVDGELSGSTTYNISLLHNSNADVLLGCRDHASYP
ncbi:MAG: S8 family serine peptidase, partial [Pontiellaceae bacterium]|nr:S8 family serine peptidase [Pontiellaceae bacterium]